MAHPKTRKTKKKHTRPTPGKTNPDAAGIDLGSTVHYVAVPAERDEHPVRHYGTLTEDLVELADWLKQCRISTVAMEATGVYWIPLFQILEDRGFEVCLVNARHVKNVPGRKSDVQDCQWLQYLHSVGLLNASFRPPAQICAVRSLMRHRESLMRTACQHLLRVQKALDQMNVQLHHAVTDITGYTGLAILDAIIAGERDPVALARLRDYRCKKSEATIAKALRGDWREEHLFTLRQSLEAWRFHQNLMADCDQQIASLMAELEDRPVEPVPETKGKPKKTHNEPLRLELCQKFGVDLTAVEGVSIQTCLTFLSEVGTDVDKFASAEHFASWMGLCPDNRITGGRTHAAHTRKVQNRLATALRMAAQSLHRSKAGLGDWFRRIKSKLGTKAAVTAAAHKLARILWAMVKYRCPYEPSRLGNPELARAKKEAYLRRQAKQLGFALTPADGAVS
ncbi:MAG: IS110 family transposase [Verrucomicrobia bacterium]|jgi:transposase|nr:IS110 family transposase [Verrucomicrobiota bacterium]